MKSSPHLTLTKSNNFKILEAMEFQIRRGATKKVKGNEETTCSEVKEKQKHYKMGTSVAPTPSSHQELALTYHLTSNICFPFHLCYAKPLLQLNKCHSHNQSVSGDHRLPEPHFVNSCKEEIFTGASHFRLQHNQTSNLGHCLYPATAFSVQSLSVCIIVKVKLQ